MTTRSRVAVLLAALVAAPAARADDAALLEKIHQLELRIQDLEANRTAPVSATGPPDWTRNIRLTGSADSGYFGGQKNSLFDPGGFQVWDARLMLDAHLGEDVRLGESTILRDVGFTFEWNLVRIGSLQNNVGELYADFQGIGEQDWANLQVGRFQIPVGEAYLRYSSGVSNKPFVSNPVGGPWWWDEGLRGYGFADGGRFGYVWSITDGETPFNSETQGANQFSLKLIAQPYPWLRLSVSGLHGGETGTGTQPASASLWLGETWGRAFGSGTGVTSYQNGVAVPDGPNQLEQTWLAAGDAIADFEDRARLWLAYGRYEMDSRNAGSYDRVLHYWIAELLLRGAWLAPSLRPFYAGVRGSALGTYDSDKGYLLDYRRASTLGYNMKSLMALSAVLGWEITSNVRIRAEYTHQDIGLVGGVTRDIRAAARPADYFAFEVGTGF